MAAALLVLIAAAWVYVLWLAADMEMGGMDMAEFRMIPAGLGLMMPAAVPWQPIEFVFVFVMWAVMTLGMMTPSAAPMILIYARVGRQAALQRQPFASASWFAAGYILAWMAFAFVATFTQWAIERWGWLTPSMAANSAILSGIVLVAAGLYQWSPVKDACLRHCQAPLQFIQRHGGFRADAAGSLILGARHGCYCIGCCWLLMALLFVVGVMNVFWVGLIMAFVLLEKVVPGGRLISRIAGTGLIAAGMWLMAQSR